MAPLHRRIHRQPSLASQVYALLCDGIVTGTIGPGERLLLDRLATDLGVSPTPVREAVARLVQEGLITETSDGKLHVVHLTPQYVLDTFLVRGALEGLAAELAAVRISDQDLAALRQALAAIPETLARGQIEVHTRTDAYLHRSIFEATGNVVLVRELHALQYHVDLIRGYSHRHVGDHLELSHAEHVQIVDALASHDPLAARRAMELHIRNAADRIVQITDFRAARRPPVVT